MRAVDLIVVQSRAFDNNSRKSESHMIQHKLMLHRILKVEMCRGWSRAAVAALDPKPAA